MLVLTTILSDLFNRDLNRLKQEIEAYQSEEAIWLTESGIKNSAGNLCLHLIGNLNTYIGAELGHTQYIRHRELEFSLKDIPRSELVKRIDETRVIVAAALAQLPDEALAADYPMLVLESKTSTAYLLTHLATHLAYHLGQVNYHRRLLDKGLSEK